MNDAKYQMKFVSISDTIKKIQSLKNTNITLDTIIDIVCQYGLRHDPRKVYGQYQKCETDSVDKGLWQRPNQIAEYIKLLLKFNIKSHLDIGTNNGDTYLIIREFLKLNNPMLFSKTIDVRKLFSTEYQNQFNINFEQCSIFNINQSFESVFIDGSHKYQDVKTDFWYCISNNAKYIAFHDIDDRVCADVGRLWKEIKNDPVLINKFDIYEFIDPDHIMGIGLLIFKNII